MFSPLVSGDFTFEVALLSEDENKTIALLKKQNKNKKRLGVGGRGGGLGQGNKPRKRGDLSFSFFSLDSGETVQAREQGRGARSV